MALSKDGSFYLGKLFDTSSKKLLDQPVLYDPADLTTHAVVTGMTGSGKTGLCIGLLEETALEGIPAIAIDPKGDLTNLLLHFPALLPADFQPWIDPESARREGKRLEVLAGETAETWKNGLADWGLGSQQLQELKDLVEFGLYTPGSTSGTAVNILSSFSSPELSWEDNSEILREKITTIVSALLGLVGLTDVDPLRSREHILLSNIIENAWSKSQSLDLTELILQTQNPPFERLGAFPVDNFFPEKDRFSLAILLNNFLAAPSFQIWREGQPLDVGALLYTPEGKPRHSIFYLAHLSESERMFFVTLLFASIESWMRTQRGTGGLRALVYMDEILGYLPPTANPPSRPILLRLLKQARAFGVGFLLATQNPVDVDYKGLSNAGTWIIGRLQTDQDKQRLLDGLESAGGDLDRKSADQLISGLGKRTFLLHNVHAKAPQVFQTRWALNYLAGPLTRSQIPQLMALAGVQAAQTAQAASSTPQSKPASAQAAAPAGPAAAVASPSAGAETLSQTRPGLPAGINEYFLPNDLPFGQALQEAKISSSATVAQQGIIYRPALLAQADVHYLARKYNLDFDRHFASLPIEARGRQVAWEDFPASAYAPDQLSAAPVPGSSYAPLPGWLSDGRQVNAWQQDFTDWVYRSSAIHLKVNEKLNLAAGPETNSGEFHEMCSTAAKKAMKEETDKVDAAYKKKLAALEQKVKRQEREVDSQKDEVSQRRLEEAGAGGELILGLLGGRKRTVSKTLSKHRMASQAKEDLAEEKVELEGLQKQQKDLQAEYQQALQEVQQRWADVASEVSEVPLTPYKKDIYVNAFGVAWLPYYRLTVDSQEREIPAHKAAGESGK